MKTHLFILNLKKYIYIHHIYITPLDVCLTVCR